MEYAMMGILVYRWTSAADVILDTAGGMTGTFLAGWGLQLAEKVRRKKIEKNNKDKDA